MRVDWLIYDSDYRTILAEETTDSKYYDSRSLRDMGIKSRLESSANKSRTISALSRPKVTSSSSTQSTGYRIVVSNLQANVTQEDIKVQYTSTAGKIFPENVRICVIFIKKNITLYRSYSKMSESYSYRD